MCRFYASSDAFSTYYTSHLREEGVYVTRPVFKISNVAVISYTFAMSLYRILHAAVKIWTNVMLSITTLFSSSPLQSDVTYQNLQAFVDRDATT
jgi:hypothetical protein